MLSQNEVGGAAGSHCWHTRPMSHTARRCEGMGTHGNVILSERPTAVIFISAICIADNTATSHKINQKCVETVTLSEDSRCKPSLSFTTRKDKYHRNFKHLFFTVPSLISSPTSRERTPCSFPNYFSLCCFHHLHLVLHWEVLLLFGSQQERHKHFQDR